MLSQAANQQCVDVDMEEGPENNWKYLNDKEIHQLDLT